MPFSKIIEKSFKYPWENRALWFYGIILAIFSGGSSISNTYDPTDKEWQSVMEKIKNIPSISGLSEKTWIIIAVVAILAVIILSILALVVSSWATAAGNRGAELVYKGKKIERKKIGKTGKKVVWKMIVLNFFIPLLLILGITTTVLIGVMIFSLIPKPYGAYLGIPIGIAACVMFIMGAIYLSVVWPLAIRYATNEDSDAWDSLKSAHALIKSKKKFWITLGFNIVIAMIAAAGAFVALIPLMIIAVALIGLLVANVYVGVIICGVLAFIYLMPLIIFEGYLQAFILTGQTLWWLELKKLK